MKNEYVVDKVERYYIEVLFNLTRRIFNEQLPYDLVKLPLSPSTCKEEDGC